MHIGFSMRTNGNAPFDGSVLDVVDSIFKASNVFCIFLLLPLLLLFVLFCSQYIRGTLHVYCFEILKYDANFCDNCIEQGKNQIKHKKEKNL